MEPKYRCGGIIGSGGKFFSLLLENVCFAHPLKWKEKVENRIQMLKKLVKIKNKGPKQKLK